MEFHDVILLLNLLIGFCFHNPIKQKVSGRPTAGDLSLEAKIAYLEMENEFLKS